MTDLETMLAMLRRAAIEFKEDRSGDGVTEIVVTEGYFGFFCSLTFAPNGALTRMAAYE